MFLGVLKPPLRLFVQDEHRRRVLITTIGWRGRNVKSRFICNLVNSDSKKLLLGTFCSHPRLFIWDEHRDTGVSAHRVLCMRRLSRHLQGT